MAKVEDVKVIVVVDAIREERQHRGKGPCHCTYYGRNNHTSDKYWDKFDKPERAQVVDTMSTSNSAATSFTAASTVHIFQSDYGHLFQLQTAQTFQSTNTTLHGSASGTSVFIAPLISFRY